MSDKHKLKLSVIVTIILSLLLLIGVISIVAKFIFQGDVISRERNQIVRNIKSIYPEYKYFQMTNEDKLSNKNKQTFYSKNGTGIEVLIDKKFSYIGMISDFGQRVDCLQYYKIGRFNENIKKSSSYRFPKSHKGDMQRVTVSNFDFVNCNPI